MPRPGAGGGVLFPAVLLPRVSLEGLAAARLRTPIIGLVDGVPSTTVVADHAIGTGALRPLLLGAAQVRAAPLAGEPLGQALQVRQAEGVDAAEPAAGALATITGSPQPTHRKWSQLFVTRGSEPLLFVAAWGLGCYSYDGADWSQLACHERVTQIATHPDDSQIVVAVSGEEAFMDDVIGARNVEISLTELIERGPPE